VNSSNGKYCKNCGKPLVDDGNFCSACGTQVGQPTFTYISPTPEFNASGAAPVQPYRPDIAPPAQPYGTDTTPPIQSYSADITPPIQPYNPEMMPPAQPYSADMIPPTQPYNPDTMSSVQPYSADMIPPAQSYGTDTMPPVQPYNSQPYNTQPYSTSTPPQSSPRRKEVVLIVIAALLVPLLILGGCVVLAFVGHDTYVSDEEAVVTLAPIPTPEPTPELRPEPTPTPDPTTKPTPEPAPTPEPVPEVTPEMLRGMWELSPDDDDSFPFIYLNENGTGLSSDWFYWDVWNNVLYIYFPFEDDFREYDVEVCAEGCHLFFIHDDDTWTRYEWVDYSVFEYIQEPDLIGTWTLETARDSFDELIFLENGDGSASLEDGTSFAFTWSVYENVLVIFYEIELTERAYLFERVDDTLIFFYHDRTTATYNLTP